LTAGCVLRTGRVIWTRHAEGGSERTEVSVVGQAARGGQVPGEGEGGVGAATQLSRRVTGGTYWAAVSAIFTADGLQG